MLGPGERAHVGTGLAVAIPEGYAGFVAAALWPRRRHGLTIVNTPGLVDPATAARCASSS